ncbi:MAG: SDR family oxidoreductase [Actinobacteria bacterium]|nr:SDR family oxidoreductase [Actinomycetota bacterium]
MKLEGKVAIVTGAARGMGAATCIALAKEGADIAALDICGPKESGFGQKGQLENTINEVKKLGCRAIALVCDITQEDQVKAAINQTADTFGKINILVNSVGFVRFGLVQEMSYEVWKKIFDVNIHGVFLTCKYALPIIIKQNGGRIINISSDGGLRAIPNYSAYCASKFAVIGLTQSLANEVGKYNITVNAVCPAATTGEFFDSQVQLLNTTKEELKKSAVNRNIIQEMITPEDVANAIAWLCTDNARFITGHPLCVDAGSVAKVTY